MRSLFISLALLCCIAFPHYSFASFVSDHSIIAPTEDLVRECERVLSDSKDSFKQMVVRGKCGIVEEGSDYDMIKRGRFISKIRVQGTIVYARTINCCEN